AGAAARRASISEIAVPPAAASVKRRARSATGSTRPRRNPEATRRATRRTVTAAWLRMRDPTARAVGLAYGTRSVQVMVLSTVAGIMGAAFPWKSAHDSPEPSPACVALTDHPWLVASPKLSVTLSEATKPR